MKTVLTACAEYAPEMNIMTLITIMWTSRIVNHVNTVNSVKAIW